jgi:hypothetical protein
VLADIKADQDEGIGQLDDADRENDEVEYEAWKVRTFVFACPITVAEIDLSPTQLLHCLMGRCESCFALSETATNASALKKNGLCGPYCFSFYYPKFFFLCSAMLLPLLAPPSPLSAAPLLVPTTLLCSHGQAGD